MPLLAPALITAALAATLAAPGDGLVSSQPTEIVSTPAQPVLAPHRFWDWQNDVLFAGVAAGRAFDFFSTRQFRAKHLKEWLLDDQTVDNRPIFAAIEVAGTAASIAASYLLHRTGYHRLERWASIVHITCATAGGVWNLTLPNGL